MKQIFRELRIYYVELDKRVFACTGFIMALAIFINYYWGLNSRISVMNDPQQMISWYFVFLVLFAAVYFFTCLFTGMCFFDNPKFLALLFFSPALFAWKMAFGFSITYSGDELMNAYWNSVSYWPLKLMVVAFFLFLVWKLVDRGKEWFGLRTESFSLRPYFLMLLMMVPLVALASTQNDFLAVYPKLKNISYLPETSLSLFYKLLYEIAYGIDFITIELFFRGFLVLAFVKFAGKHAILPMAAFYCAIHFGKPLGECISSFFGGILLGVVTYHTRTIYGGLVVHLGIAWLMELGGALGNYFH